MSTVWGALPLQIYFPWSLTGHLSVASSMTVGGRQTGGGRRKQGHIRRQLALALTDHRHLNLPHSVKPDANCTSCRHTLIDSSMSLCELVPHGDLLFC